jgi:uncharacterized protein
MTDKFLNNYSRHVEFLGVDLSDVHQVGAFGSQVLHLAAFAGRRDDVEEILSAGADVNALGDLGLSAVHYAVLGGNLDVVQLLASKGANLALENEFGETPAQMAHVMHHSDIEELLSQLRPAPIFSSDGWDVAEERWREFRSIQEANFRT